MSLIKRYSLKPGAFIALVAALLTGLAFVSFALFHVVAEDTTGRVPASAFGAFLGAFFAFLFVRIGNGLTRLYERHAKHHTALVKAQHHLNELHSDLDDNLYLARGFGETLSLSTSQTVRVTATRLQPLELRQDFVIELMNVDLVNDLFALFVHLRKQNSSMATVNRMYEGILGRLGNEPAAAQAYNDSLSSLITALQDIAKFLEDNKTEVLTNLARARVLASDMPFLGWVQRLISLQRYPRGFDRALAAELDDLRAELHTAESESSSHIEKILGRRP